ncbi:MAG: LPS export ABC transporter periplasmic protein LptC [Steroidobacterales bacterium]
MRFRLFTLLAVLALAVSAWFLSSPKLLPGVGSAARRVENPGYFLKDSVLTEYDANGNPSIRIAARRIDQVPHSDEIMLHDIRVDYQAPDGAAWVMVGDHAHIRPGGTVVDLSGNVELQGKERDRTGAPVIRTDALTYDVTQSIASTSSDVRIDFLLNTLTARGLVANLREHTVRLESRISGRFHP